MSDFRILALPTGITQQVRRTGKAPGYGHPTYTETATGYGPCRHCLRTFRVGQERRILFTYDPFDGLEPIPLPGPIFIHEAPCERYPENAGYPADLAAYPAVFNAYVRGQNLLERQLLTADDKKAAALSALFERSDVDYVEVRDRTAGCFDLRAERAGERVFFC